MRDKFYHNLIFGVYMNYNEVATPFNTTKQCGSEEELNRIRMLDTMVSYLDLAIEYYNGLIKVVCHIMNKVFTNGKSQTPYVFWKIWKPNLYF